MEASDYANEGACASTTDDLIDKQVVAEKSFKKYGRFVSFDDETPRRQQSRDSANSTPYESIVIKDDSMAVSFTKYWPQFLKVIYIVHVYLVCKIKTYNIK